MTVGEFFNRLDVKDLGTDRAIAFLQGIRGPDRGVIVVGKHGYKIIVWTGDQYRDVSPCEPIAWFQP